MKYVHRFASLFPVGRFERKFRGTAGELAKGGRPFVICFPRAFKMQAEGLKENDKLVTEVTTIEKEMLKKVNATRHIDHL